MAIIFFYVSVCLLVCFCICFSTRYCKEWCRCYHQTRHRYGPPRVLETHFFEIKYSKVTLHKNTSVSLQKECNSAVCCCVLLLPVLRPHGRCCWLPVFSCVAFLAICHHRCGSWHSCECWLLVKTINIDYYSFTVLISLKDFTIKICSDLFMYFQYQFCQICKIGYWYWQIFI